jgi:hypothetical protein
MVSVEFARFTPTCVGNRVRGLGAKDCLTGLRGGAHIVTLGVWGQGPQCPGPPPYAWGILDSRFRGNDSKGFTTTCVGNTKCRKQDLTPITHDSCLRLSNVSEEK